MVFVFATLLVLFFHAFGTRLLRADLYRETLVQQHFYDQLPAALGPLLTSGTKAAAKTAPSPPGNANVERDAPPTPTPPELPPEDWDALLSPVIPPSLIRTEVERGLEQLERYLHGTGANPPAVISLTEIKRRLRSPEATQAYAQMLAGKPAGTPQQWEAAHGLPIRFCPAQDKLPEALANHRRLLQVLADRLPNTIDLFHPVSTPTNARVPGQPATLQPAIVRRVELAARWSPVVPVALALLIALLAARSVRALLLWWGIPLIIVGLLGISIASSTAGVASQAVQNLASDGVPTNVQLLVQVITSFTHAIMSSVVWTCVVLAAGGVAAVILAMTVRELQPAASPTATFRPDGG